MKVVLPYTHTHAGHPEVLQCLNTPSASDKELALEPTMQGPCILLIAAHAPDFAPGFELSQYFPQCPGQNHSEACAANIVAHARGQQPLSNILPSELGQDVRDVGGMLTLCMP